MSLVKSVAGSTLRVQQQQNGKPQQKCSKPGATPPNNSSNNSNSNANSNHSLATTASQTSTVNCLQTSSPPLISSKTSLSLSPIAANFMGSSNCSSSLFSFESGVVLSGSSGCCSLSNSPSSSSSSSSKSYLPSQAIEQTTSGNPVCANMSITASHLEESFSSNTCPLNSSLLAAVNGDFEDDHVMSKTLSDASNQKESNLHTSESMDSSSNDNESNGGNSQILLLESIRQQSTAESSCLNNEDARTLQLAVELTMMNLNQMPSPTSGTQAISTSTATASNHFQQLQAHHFHNGASIDHQQLHQPFSSSSSYTTSVNNPYHMSTKLFLQTQSQAAATTLISQKFLSDPSQDNNIPSKMSALTSNHNQNIIAVTTSTSDERSKKSQNMTECVPVPSSEHVAEIVGRQGCKIKALRAKTNTYIKTPVRNEEPVFVVTGRKEDVAKAKREILSAAEHFTLIRATRRTNDGMGGCSANLASGGAGQFISLNKNSLSTTAPLPGQVTIQVRVPYRVVGLVVGPKGNTIKHIQHETQTYIVTPSRDKEPIFEVTGMPDNVQMARKQIEAHIATRTGNSLSNALSIPAPPPPPPPPPAPAGVISRLNETVNCTQNSTSFHSINALNQILSDDLHSEILSSIYKNGIGSALEYSQISGNVMNAASKCNNSNPFNGYISSEINPGTFSVNEIQRRVAMNSGNCNANNFDFINSLMDSSSAQFVNEQNTNFPQLTNNTNAIKSLKSVINTINILENSTNGAGSLLQQPNGLSTNALLTRSCSSASSTASSSKSLSNSGNNNNTQVWKPFNGGATSVTATNGSCSGTGTVNNDCIDIDEGIGESPLYSWGLPNTLAALTNSYCSPASTSISPTDSLFGEHVHNKTGTAILQQQQKIKNSSKTKILENVKRSNCWICQEKDIVAALLPCGHKMFCYDCANRLCQQNDANCPVCSTQIYQFVRI